MNNNTQHDEDLAIIEAATPGPWFGWNSKDLAAIECGEVMHEGYQLASLSFPKGSSSTCGLDERNANVQFIAHFNPLKCRQLVEENRALRGMLRVAAAEIEWLGQAGHGTTAERIKELLK